VENVPAAAVMQQDHANRSGCRLLGGTATAFEGYEP
jgi:hypothetical protein